jgi:hypothetical protein
MSNLVWKGGTCDLLAKGVSQITGIFKITVGVFVPCELSYLQSVKIRLNQRY